jgi:hypothetical protein
MAWVAIYVYLNARVHMALPKYRLEQKKKKAWIKVKDSLDAENCKDTFDWLFSSFVMSSLLSSDLLPMEGLPGFRSSFTRSE